mgnify:CR=1 FL=1
MEEIERKGFPVSRVTELYKEDGIMITEEQAEKILAFSQKLVNIVVSQYITTLEVVESTTKLREVS